MNEHIGYQQALNNLVILRRTLSRDGIDSATLLIICSAIITHIGMCFDIDEKTIQQNAKLYDPHFPDEV